MYFIIAGWGYDNRVYASMKFFIYTFAGSAVMLVGMLALVLLHANANGGTVDVRPDRADAGQRGRRAPRPA